MLRGLFLAGLSLVVLLPSSVSAQLRDRVKITGVRLGFPSGPFGSDNSRKGVFKAGQWAPVYIDLECARETEEGLLLVVETKDADDVITEGVVEIGAMDKGDRLLGNELGRIPYLKPGSVYATVKVTVKGAKSGKTFGESGERSFNAIEGPSFVMVGVGTNLASLRLQTGRGNQDDDNPNNQGMNRELRGGWVETAQLIDVGMMPDQWIGYGAADLVVIGTGGDASFWETLAAPQHERRRKALVEWVRRGGRAILSVGTNPQVLEPLKELRDMLPATIPADGKRTVNQLPYNWLARGSENQRFSGILTFPDGKSPFSVVALQPRADRAFKTLVSEDDKGRIPQAVQGAFGLGRVTVVGFDLDRGPFSDWVQRRDFWDSLVVQAGYKLPNANDKFDKYGRSDNDYARALQGSLDFFEGVPVVSFGWVALFILIYIVLIGPVDYLFLKKVVKRLEWTWVTFPVIVITVSAGAYFAAYALKGRDLKTNKVDVVDIDLAGNRVYGNTWFTLFSPRIQNYTIGVEPGGPTWTSADSTVAAHDTILSWQSAVESNRYGGSGGSGIFTKHYKYQSTNDPHDPNRDLYASGLEGVPIQVWTTKAFSAEWSAPIDPASPPVSAELAVSPANPNVLIGNVTNHLPFEAFTDAALFWRGRYFDLGTVLPTDVAKAISFSVEQNGDTLKNWMASTSRGPTYVTPKTSTSWNSSENSGTPQNPKFPLWPVLFSDAINDRNSQAPNASLRRLDQSWRVAEDRSEQAILVLRIATREGAQAEDMARDPASPSRLWLGDLPTSGGKRPSMQGTLKQETYIRVLIPVKQAPAKK